MRRRPLRYLFYWRLTLNRRYGDVIRGFALLFRSRIGARCPGAEWGEKIRRARKSGILILCTENSRCRNAVPAPGWRPRFLLLLAIVSETQSFEL